MRCWCQGQSIASPTADLASMGAKVQELVREGRGQEGVIEYMTARYGDFVLYRPPVDQRTWLLWFGPFVLIAVAVFALLFAIRRVRGRRPEPASGRRKTAPSGCSVKTAIAIPETGHDPGDRPCHPGSDGTGPCLCVAAAAAPPPCRGPGRAPGNPGRASGAFRGAGRRPGVGQHHRSGVPGGP
ncbi:MAG: cytochrome c-type biogenesis protein [Arhodomonas sp.]|nr:cytochrome c-type biogenesis protein [Arhodomonas sp.]